jgi:c-di-GMP-related signal transduction protein
MPLKFAVRNAILGGSKMLEQLLDEANRATREYDEQKVEYFMQELVKSPDEAIKVLVNALRQPDKIRQAMAVPKVKTVFGQK